MIFIMKKRIIILVALTAIGILAMSSVSMAASLTRNLNVTASVATNCSIISVTDVAFGEYDPTNATDLDVNGDLTFRCTKNTNYKTYIAGTRQMFGATYFENLNFELYSDVGRTTIYPSTNAGGSTLTPNNSPITSTIYGRVPAFQNASLDNYSKVLTVAVEY
jgi:spore coat protein U-like protein